MACNNYAVLSGFGCHTWGVALLWLCRQSCRRRELRYFNLGVAAASDNIVMRRVSLLKGDSWRRLSMWPLIAVSRFPAAAMTASAGVTVGFEIYLCLWKAVDDTWVAQVFIIQIVHAWYCSKELPRNYTFLQCAAKVFIQLGLSCTRESMLIGTTGSVLWSC